MVFKNLIHTDLMESHPCFRPCSSDPSTQMTCGYNFTLEYFWLLSKACYDCPKTQSDCSRYDCIPGMHYLTKANSYV